MKVFKLNRTALYAIIFVLLVGYFIRGIPGKVDFYIYDTRYQKVVELLQQDRFLDIKTISSWLIYFWDSRECSKTDSACAEKYSDLFQAVDDTPAYYFYHNNREGEKWDWQVRVIPSWIISDFFWYSYVYWRGRFASHSWTLIEERCEQLNDDWATCQDMR